MHVTTTLNDFLAKSSNKQKLPLGKEQVAVLLHFCFCNARDLFDEAPAFSAITTRGCRRCARCCWNFHTTRRFERWMMPSCLATACSPPRFWVSQPQGRCCRSEERRV